MLVVYGKPEGSDQRSGGTVSKLELLLTVEIEPCVGKLLGRYGLLFYTIIVLMRDRCS